MKKERKKGRNVSMETEKLQNWRESEGGMADSLVGSNDKVRMFFFFEEFL